MKRIVLSNAFRGLLAALTADLAFTMVLAFMARAFAGPAGTENTDHLFRLAFPVLTFIGMPAGLVYGFFMAKARNNPGASQNKGHFRFWVHFWWLLAAFMLARSLVFGVLTSGTLGPLVISLLVYTGIWTYLMKVISENPLSFSHLMPEPSEMDNKFQGSNSGALVKKRRG